jgi:hypothetical protein
MQHKKFSRTMEICLPMHQFQKVNRSGEIDAKMKFLRAVAPDLKRGLACSLLSGLTLGWAGLSGRG